MRLCMGNTLILRSELEKLCAYADKGGTITTAMVREMTSPQLESTTFQLAKAVVSRNRKRQWRNWISCTPCESTAFIVHAIASSFLDLYRAAAALRAGKQAADVKADFGYAFDFMVQNAFRDCRRLPPERLRACIRVLRELELDLNSTSGERTRHAGSGNCENACHCRRYI